MSCTPNATSCDNDLPDKHICAISSALLLLHIANHHDIIANGEYCEPPLKVMKWNVLGAKCKHFFNMALKNIK